MTVQTETVGQPTAYEGGETRSSGVDEQRFLRTDFLARLAHEIRGPLGVVLGALDEVEQEPCEHSRRQHEMLSMARRNIQRILRTAERLTRSAQLESGPLRLTQAPMDFGALVKSSAADVERMEGRRGVVVTLSLPSEPCMVELDQSWASFAVAELVAHSLRNARQNVLVGVECSDGHARLTVHDDGPSTGAPPVLRFNAPLDRRDAGLGIPLVHDVTAALGGRLELGVDLPGGARGARMTLRLQGGERTNHEVIEGG